MQQRHKLPERHFAEYMAELQESHVGTASPSRSLQLDPIELDLLHVVSHGIAPDDVVLIKKLCVGISGCCI